MAHFAQVQNNIVTQVIVADSKEWCESRLGGEWIQTSYNTRGGIHLNGGEPLRMNYAGIGFTYDRDKDAFIPLSPYPSWVLNEDTCLWEAPVPKLEEKEGFVSGWVEETKSWEYYPIKEII